jgi:sec-independent protein translocase protein TatA
MTLTNPVHIAFIVIVALIFLGPKRLPEVARSLGHGMREFRETLSGSGLHHDQTPGLAPESEPAVSPQHAAEAVAPPPPPPLPQ